MAFRCHQHTCGPKSVESTSQHRIRTVIRRAVSLKAVRDKQAAPVVQELLQLVQGTDRGLNTPAAVQDTILAKVAELKAAHGGSETTTDQVLSATWKLLWTTEKETLFIVKNAGLFGTKAGEVYQVIDVKQQRLQNVITFPPSGAFIVDSSIAVESAQRVSFKFNAAKLKTVSKDWNVPPFGQGWFDTVYCDDSLRVAQDIRGDTLIVTRDGPPRIFT